MSERINCVVREGRFIDACTILQEMVSNNMPVFSKTKGIAYWHLTNKNTNSESRSFYGVITEDHPRGFLFSFCPFCGVKIDKPFNEDDEA